MPLPNVLVIGAQKCGTTALHQMLEAHPSCSGGVIKETHFLVDESPWPFGRWEHGVDWYAANYADKPIRADVSPSYTGWPLFPGVVSRAEAIVPDAKIVYLVRDPVDRLISHWRHWRWRGYDTRRFHDAVLDPIEENIFLIGSSYATQLDQWLEAYPFDRIQVLHQDDVRAGAPQLWPFLGVESSEGAVPRRNASAAFATPTTVGRLLPVRVKRRLPPSLVSRSVPRPHVSDELLARLRARLRDEAARFQELTGVQVAHWV